jgi:hypothetical protein
VLGEELTKQGLQMYDEEGRTYNVACSIINTWQVYYPIISSSVSGKSIIERHLFKTEQVRDLIIKYRPELMDYVRQNHPEAKWFLPKSEEPATEDPFVVSSDSSLTWQDVTVTFMGDLEIHIQFFDKSVTRRYDQIGFEHGRSEKPVSAWHCLKQASAKKEIPYNFKNRKIVEKRAGEIRKKISRLFPNIPGDPVPIDKKENVYKFAFRLRPPME